MKKRELINQLDKDGPESFVGDRTMIAYLARKFREEKSIPAVYMGDKKIAGRRELSASGCQRFPPAALLSKMTMETLS